MRGIVEEPAGLQYVPDFLTEAQEDWLLGRLTGLEYGESACTGRWPGAWSATTASAITSRPGR